MSQVVIRALKSRRDIPAIAKIHAKAFPDSGLTALGAAALERYYMWQLDRAGRMVAMAAEMNGELIGYCLGGAYGSAAAFFRGHAGFIALQALRRPWLIADPRLKKLAPYCIGVIRKALRPKPQKARSAALALRSFGIQAIAVDPRHTGCGAGKALMAACEDAASRLGFDSIYLAVETNNSVAISFYERLGWVRVEKDGFWNGHMRKLLSTSEMAAHEKE